MTTTSGDMKMVRITEHLHAEISRLAHSERRSLQAQLELLLEQALGVRPNPIVTDVPEQILGPALPHKMDHTRPPKAPPPPVVRVAPKSLAAEREFKPDFVDKKMKG